MIKQWLDKRRLKRELTTLMNELESLYNTRPYNLSRTVEVSAKMAEIRAEMKRKGYVNG